MESWSEVARIPPRVAATDGTSITLVLFDSTTNLLWCGDAAGYQSLFSPYQGPHFHLYPYTKFRAVRGAEIISSLSHRDGILLLGSLNVNFNNRRGVCKVSVNPDTLASKDQSDMLHSLRSFTFNCSAINDVVVGGSQGLAKFDLHKPHHLVAFDYKGSISKLHHTAKFLAIGGMEGLMDLFDPVSNSVVKQFAGHNGGRIIDIDIQGSYIATCGESCRPSPLRKLAEYYTDPLVNIYDVRMMKPLAPISFPAGASSVRFHPKLPNIIIMALKYGQIQFVDIYDQLNVFVYQVDPLGPPPVKGAPARFAHLQISDNGDFMAFTDGVTTNNLHLWSYSALNKDFTSFPALLDQPDFVADILPPPMSVDGDVPLSTVGLPYYKDLLLSNYANDLIFTKELAKVPVTPTSDTQGWHPYDKQKFGQRNQIQPYQSLTASKSSRKFLSEQNLTPNPNDSGANHVFDYTLATGVPPCYAKHEIQYSKFGVRDFDFRFYNRSEGQFSGLELQTNNSYINLVLQLYSFCSGLYNHVIDALVPEDLPNDPDTIMNGNPQGSSVLLETAYLFDMMHKALGTNVVIGNLSQILTSNKEAQAQGLVVDDNILAQLTSIDLTNLLIRFNHFFLDQLQPLELMKIPFSVTYQGQCGETRSHQGQQYALEILTPPTLFLSNRYRRPTSLLIIHYIEHSLSRSDEIPCNLSHKNHSTGEPPAHLMEVLMVISQLPPVLLLALCLNSDDFAAISTSKKWLAPSFWVGRHPNTGKPQIKSSQSEGAFSYKLLGYVCQVSHAPNTPDARGVNNLVTFVKRDDKWWLFNDFLVMEIPESEVFNLSYSWKRPIMILYTREDVENVPYKYFDVPTFAGRNVDDSIIYRDHFARGLREDAQRTYTLLTREEAPRPGTLIAIDAEFVTLKPDLVEVFAKGYRRVLRPKQYSLARVSVLRGEGSAMGLAFIDDYIVHTLVIHDYLTNYSGIEPGDLDLNQSLKGLVTLQTAYRKLWLLLNMGCIFVGHGLYNDFRCINLQVPQAQICDTIELFYKQDFKRQLSLKFLAYVLLQTDVQTGNHDSIEDAYTALMLFNKYRQLKREGTFEQALNRIYAEGQQLRFKVPELAEQN